MSNHSKAKEEKGQKTFYLSLRIQEAIKRIAQDEERSDSFIAERLLENALKGKMQAA